MPFTFSHPAAVLPFRKLCNRYLSFAGLAIGSVIPDFEYFIRMKSKYSHTFDGMFWFDLPLAVFVAFLFFNIVRNDLLDNLPIFIKSRLVALREFKWNSYFINNCGRVLVSMLIGISTHVLWDSFTHRTGWFVQQSEFLRGNMLMFGGIPVYRMLQHTSTVLGGLIILTFVYLQPVQTVQKKISPLYWAVVASLTCITAGISFYKIGHLDLWYVVIILMASGFAALTAAPLVIAIAKETPFIKR